MYVPIQTFEVFLNADDARLNSSAVGSADREVSSRTKLLSAAREMGLSLENRHEEHVSDLEQPPRTHRQERLNRVSCGARRENFQVTESDPRGSNG